LASFRSRDKALDLGLQIVHGLKVERAPTCNTARVYSSAWHLLVDPRLSGSS